MADDDYGDADYLNNLDVDAIVAQSTPPPSEKKNGNKLIQENETSESVSKEDVKSIHSFVLSLPHDRRDAHNSQGRGKETWREVCDKWGMVVSRDILYSQECFFEDEVTLDDDNLPKSDDLPSGPQTSEPTRKMIGSDLVVSRLDSGSPAALAGIMRGDVIHAVYGMRNPCPKLLFGIMSNSSTFE